MIQYGSKIVRKINGDTGVCIGWPFSVKNGKAIMIRWDNGRTFPINLNAITEA